MTAFFSRGSGEQLTNDLVELPDLSRLNTTDGEAYVPEGHFVVLDDSFFFGVAGKYAVNIRDLRLRKLHASASRLNGCCGLDGCDGCNLVDSRGGEIGTEKSDCWMPHCAILEPDKVELRSHEDKA